MPQETKSKFEPRAGASVAEQPFAREATPFSPGPSGLAGSAIDLSDAASAFDILEKAFDYRGDVTLTLRDGSSVSGYLFDRRKGKGLGDSVVRLMLPEGGGGGGGGGGSGVKRDVAYDQVTRVAFSERDPAAGKSFETWVKKYVEKKLKGERASIESETLD